MSFLESIKQKAFEKLVAKSEKSQAGMDQLVQKLKKHPALASGCFCKDEDWDKLSYQECCDAIRKAVKLGVHEIQFHPDFDLDKPFKMVYRRKEGTAVPIVFIANVDKEVPAMGMRFDVKIMPGDIEIVAYLMTRVWWLTMLSGKFKDPAKAKAEIEKQLHLLQDDVTQLLLTLRRALNNCLFSDSKPTNDNYQEWLVGLALKTTACKKAIARCGVDELHQYLMAVLCRQNVLVNCTPLRTSMKAYTALTDKVPSSMVQNFLATYHSNKDFAEACEELWQHFPSPEEIPLEVD